MRQRLMASWSLLAVVSGCHAPAERMALSEGPIGWMEEVFDGRPDILIGNILFPGTHDSASYGCAVENGISPSAGDLLVGLPLLAVFLVLIAVAKSGVAYLLARLARLPARPGQLAVGLGQMGEFGFVLGTALVGAGAITGSLYVAMLAAIVVSIAASAILVRFVVPGDREAGAGGGAPAKVRFQPDA